MDGFEGLTNFVGEAPRGGEANASGVKANFLVGIELEEEEVRFPEFAESEQAFARGLGRCWGSELVPHTGEFDCFIEQRNGIGEESGVLVRVRSEPVGALGDEGVMWQGRLEVMSGVAALEPEFESVILIREQGRKRHDG